MDTPYCTAYNENPKVSMVRPIDKLNSSNEIPYLQATVQLAKLGAIFSVSNLQVEGTKKRTSDEYIQEKYNFKEKWISIAIPPLKRTVSIWSQQDTSLTYNATEKKIQLISLHTKKQQILLIQ